MNNFDNKMYNKFIVFLVLILIVTFSGCSSKFGLPSSNGMGPSKTPDVDTSGKGLEVKFSVDDQWISTKRVDYTITLKNSGLNEIILSDDNIKLSTMQSTNDLTSVFTDESIIDFENSILMDGGQLALYHDESREDIRGSLFVKDTFFNDMTYEKINYILSVNYDYETEFSNNLEFDLGSKTIMRVLDKVAQAAPVNIYKIEMTPYDGDEYILNYYFRDNGPSGSNGNSISIQKSDIDLVFRQKSLSTHSCKILTKVNGEYVESTSDAIVLNKDNREVILGCKVNLGDIEKNDIMTTATSGTFKYKYYLKFDGSITLPKNRDNQLNWN